MFAKILVPLDGGDVAAGVLPSALSLARATGATLSLLRVVEEDSREVRAAAEASLTLVAAGLRASGVPTEVNVRAGHPAEEILAGVAEIGADAVAMATHGRSGLTRALMGSVAERVMRESRVPVLLLRPGGRAIEKLTTLLVPVDGSPGGTHALALALPLARTCRARIVLVQVVLPIPSYPATEFGGYGGIHYDPAWDQAALAAAQQYVTAVARRVKRAGVPAEGRALLASPVADHIARTAEDVGADLIVMSTHAHTGPVRALLGSVADAVVRTSGRPVLLVRREGTVAEGFFRAA